MFSKIECGVRRTMRELVIKLEEYLYQDEK